MALTAEEKKRMEYIEGMLTGMEKEYEDTILISIQEIFGKPMIMEESVGDLREELSELREKQHKD